VDRVRRGATSDGVRSLLETARPLQWFKNILVFAAPMAAIVVDRQVDIDSVVVAAITFSVVSSGVYFLNDVLDAEADRHHPRKRLRPVASGRLSVRAALSTGFLLLLAGDAVAIGAVGLRLAAVLLVYEAISIAYSLGLKKVAYVELLCVASGFVLRTLAGGVAAGIPVSRYFLVVACSGALLVVAGKRTAELMTLGDDPTSHRQVLTAYRSRTLKRIRRGLAVVTVAAYSTWTITRWQAVPSRVSGLFILASVIPFAAGVALLEQALTAGRAGAPERLAAHSRPLQVCAAGVAVLLLVASVQ
jgi:decaprenyl-phosphate phosphoribosyltransferase